LEYRKLGKSGLLVSRLSFGTLPLAQHKAPLGEGAFLLREALKSGINLFDTAELYGTYGYLKEAFFSISPQPFIISRSYAYTAGDMEKSLKKAIRETGLKIDIFMLHQQESSLTLKGHSEALNYLVYARNNGLIRAVGISTHHIAAVRAASEIEQVDIIFAILNKRGMGIQDGTAQDMIEALNSAHEAGKGTILMKALGGGHLIQDCEDALKFCMEFTFADSVVVGMKSIDELKMNLLLEAEKKIPQELKKKLSSQRRRILIEDCTGCGKCASACPFKAIHLEEGKAAVEERFCIQCGYCAFHCPEFCIKVI